MGEQNDVVLNEFDKKIEEIKSRKHNDGRNRDDCCELLCDLREAVFSFAAELERVKAENESLRQRLAGQFLPAAEPSLPGGCQG